MELLPEAQWRAPSKVLLSATHREQALDTAGAKDTDAAGADAEPDGGHIAQARARLLRCHDSFDGRAWDQTLQLCWTSDPGFMHWPSVIEATLGLPSGDVLSR